MKNKKEKGFWDYISYPGMLLLIVIIINLVIKIYNGTI